MGVTPKGFRTPDEKVIIEDGKVLSRGVQVKDEAEVTVFEVTGEGSVFHGKSKHEQDPSVLGGIVMYSPTKKWRLTVSDTGQIVTTQIE